MCYQTKRPPTTQIPKHLAHTEDTQEHVSVGKIFVTLYAHALLIVSGPLSRNGQGALGRLRRAKSRGGEVIIHRDKQLHVQV